MNEKKCYKCKKVGVAVHTRHHFACKECFNGSIIKYFRTQLNKLKIPRESSILLAYSGGCCSTAMVSLFYEALHTTKTRLSYNISLITISFEAIEDLIKPSTKSDIPTLAKKYNYPIITIPAETHPLFNGDKELMHTVFSQMKSIDSKYDLMELIEKQLLIQHASSLEGSQYLLFGYTMDHYTEQVVHSMSNRLGFSMSYYQTPNQLYQVPNTQVFIGSVLSDLTSRELSIFCHYQKVDYHTTSTFLRCKGQSVYRLTLDMIESLQDDCDSTLHIVTETCGKLQQCPVVLSDQAKLCKLCKEYCNEELCGRCQFLVKEDNSQVLKKFVEKYSCLF